MAEPLKIQYWEIGRLLPYAANARTHSPVQVEQIANSIKQFGFNVPVMVDAKGELVAGHGRLLGAKRLGLAEVPVVVLGHLTEAQIRAYRVADNQIALNSDWDVSLLLAELQHIREDGIDPKLLGFDDEGMGALLAGINSGGAGSAETEASENDDACPFCKGTGRRTVAEDSDKPPPARNGDSPLAVAPRVIGGEV
jgi:ParB-like chromosome segregation protein Spo0J